MLVPTGAVFPQTSATGLFAVSGAPSCVNLTGKMRSCAIYDRRTNPHPHPTLSLSQAHTHAHQYTKAFNCLWLEMQKHIWKTLGDVGYHRVSSVRKRSLTVKARLVSTSCVCVCVSRRGIRAWCRSVAFTQQSIDAQRTN